MVGDCLGALLEQLFGVAIRDYLNTLLRHPGLEHGLAPAGDSDGLRLGQPNDLLDVLGDASGMPAATKSVY
jgi:hypothetical protein